MKKLYMISIGGNAEGSNIETHDVQFVVADHIDDTYDIVKKNWYGIDYQLHLDSYKEIKGVTGYRITLSTEDATKKLSGNPSNSEQVYFACLGGYDANYTQELHNIGFIVSDSKAKAKIKALETIKLDGVQTHLDSLIEVSSVLLSSDNQIYYIHLTPSSETYDLKPDWFGYKRLDQ